MGWSLGHLPVREPARLEIFFLAVGKALFLAQEYEAKCQGILRGAQLFNALKEGHDLDAAYLVWEKFKDRMLHATIMEIQALPFATKPEDVEVLMRAKDARNFVAHESARLGHLWTVTAPSLESKTAELRNAVSSLAVGDNLVSRWIYEIEERARAPMTIQVEYPRWIDNWIFGAEAHV